MQLEYGVAPLSYTNGIPTHKAGEWPGILSCKFHSYKRVIRPKEHGIIYNQFESPFVPRRKILRTNFYSPEYSFKPHRKMITEEFSHENKPKGLKYINFQTEPRKFMVEKKHFFPYKTQKENDEYNNFKNLPNSKIIRNEVKLLMQENGFHKKNYFTFYNNDLKNIDFSKDNLGKLTWIQTEPYDIFKKMKENKFNEHRNTLRKNLKNDERFNTYDFKMNNQVKNISTLNTFNINNINNSIPIENEN